MQSELADIAVSVSDLKINPTAVMAGAKGAPVALLNHNRVMGYMVPPELFEAMLERLDDMDLAQLIQQRAGEVSAPVSQDDL